MAYFQPIAVCLHLGDCANVHVLLNLLLTIVLPYVGGLIHAIYVMCTMPAANSM